MCYLKQQFELLSDHFGYFVDWKYHEARKTNKIYYYRAVKARKLSMHLVKKLATLRGRPDC